MFIYRQTKIVRLERASKLQIAFTFIDCFVTKRVLSICKENMFFKCLLNCTSRTNENWKITVFGLLQFSLLYLKSYDEESYKTIRFIRVGSVRASMTSVWNISVAMEWSSSSGLVKRSRGKGGWVSYCLSLMGLVRVFSWRSSCIKRHLGIAPWCCELISNIFSSGARCLTMGMKTGTSRRKPGNSSGTNKNFFVTWKRACDGNKFRL